MKQFSNNKGVSLIIVVFAMMLLAVLGWSLAILQSTDFEVSVRQLDSERALHVAEAGAQWAMNQLSQNANWRTDDSSDGGDGEDHIFSPGEYNVLCRDPVGTEVGNAVIISTGYVPSQADYRAMRQVEIHTNEGAFVNAISGAQRFDWHGTGGHDVTVNGNIISPEFEGPDDNSWPNEPADYGNDPAIPPGIGTRTVGEITLPEIDMHYFEDYATNIEGQVLEGYQRFTKRDDLRNEGVIYVKGDVELDTSEGKIDASHTSIIAEGSIKITGDDEFTIIAHIDESRHETFPCLATKDKDIECLVTPNKQHEHQKLKAHHFGGLIYTQNGDVKFNYIEGVAIMANNIILSGSIYLDYEKESRYLDTIGYIEGAAGVINWRER